MNNKDELLEGAPSFVTSVAPTASARVHLRPVDARGVVIDEGFLAERQRLNHDVTLAHGVEQLRAGRHAPRTFRIAAGRATGQRTGMVFSDSETSTSGSRPPPGSSSASPRPSCAGYPTS